MSKQLTLAACAALRVRGERRVALRAADPSLSMGAAKAAVLRFATFATLPPCTPRRGF